MVKSGESSVISGAGKPRLILIYVWVVFIILFQKIEITSLLFPSPVYA